MPGYVHGDHGGACEGIQGEEGKGTGHLGGISFPVMS